jgi:hypothetical protein
VVVVHACVCQSTVLYTFLQGDGEQTIQAVIFDGRVKLCDFVCVCQSLTESLRRKAEGLKHA